MQAQLKLTGVCLELRMNPTNITELRIKLLFKKSEGRATESDLKHLDKLVKLIQKTKADSVTLEEDKRFMEYAKWMIDALEIKSIKDVPYTSRLQIIVKRSRFMKTVIVIGAVERNRTSDLLITNQL